VRLGDDARKCIAFLGWPDPAKPGEIDPEGTGFLLTVGGKYGVYLVTASHVALKLGKGPFGIRLNDKQGNGRVHHIERCRWFSHPTDTTVDISVIPFSPPDWADVNLFSIRSFLTNRKPRAISWPTVAAGDMAYVVGLFYLLHGKKKNLPVVHTGHIALLADDEPIPIKDWRAKDPQKAKTIHVNGYLVEAGGLPGSSGSPVFVRTSYWDYARAYVLPGEQRKFTDVGQGTYGNVYLLGVWHGAWFGEPAQVIAGPKGSTIPSGMGIVVPAQRLEEILNQPRLMRLRAEGEAKELDAKAAMPTGKNK
jgi:hypothetical protein